MKSMLAKLLFRRANIRQIHIVGCSRSGTTMMHAAMTAFGNVGVHRAETRPAQPDLGERLAIVRDFARRGITGETPKYFVTKRGFHWIDARDLEVLRRRALDERVGVIEMVRDPRDVLLSRHTDQDNYVSVDHWRKSILAAQWLRARLAPEGLFLTVRYEDFVREPGAVEAALAGSFGLHVRRGAAIDRVADSLASSGLAVDPELVRAMQGVRNADPRSIGKWRTAGDNPEARLLADADAAPLYRAFMAEHGYAEAEAEAV